MPELHRAAQRGDAAAVRRILEAGGDARTAGPRAATPLHMAMGGASQDAMNRSMAPPGQANNWSMAKARARERATRGRPDPVRGPMQFAQVTRLLLAYGADPNAVTADGLTPLHIAASTLNAELVSLLIAAGADVNAAYPPRHGLAGGTPLLAAAGGGDVDVVRALLDAGADPAKMPEKSRPYFSNLAMSDLATFRLLLERGLELPSDALKMAVRNGHVDAAAELVRRGQAADPDRALLAAFNQSDYELTREGADRLVETVRMLLDAGASPSAPDGTGEALFTAVRDGHGRVVRLLRERGAKIDWARLPDENHYHPGRIAYAARLEGRIDRLREFEELGMPLDPLGAALLGRADRLRELIASGEPPLAGEAGSPVLYFAAESGHEDCVRLLLNAKADPNARFPSWDTPDIGPRPLAGAAINGHTEVVRLLLERGADPKLLELDEDEWAKVPPEIRTLLGRDKAR